MKTSSFIPPAFWFKRNAVSYSLFPLAWLYGKIMKLRRFLYRRGIKKSTRFFVPVVVVGNLTVGGAGKTPFVIWLAKLLMENNYKVGIVSRGFGGASSNYPIVVTKDSNVTEVGDEAVMIANNVDCPLIVAPKRVAAVKKLLEIKNCDVVISDDGLQHYALARDLEIVIMDRERGFGNSFCLPAGPLREPLSRLQLVDFIVKNYTIMTLDVDGMCLIPKKLINIKDSQQVKDIEEIKDLPGQTIHAVAGIGNPDRFFKTLRFLGLHFIAHAFPDHYVFKKEDLKFGENTITIMTEKDAVKCQALVYDNAWFLQVKTEISENLQTELLMEITKLMRR